MDATTRTRLDRLLVATGRYATRSRAADAIRRGCVRVNGVAASQPSRPVSPADAIDIDDAAARYVSRAALKLRAGLAATGFDPSGRVALDLGASTGGFTQVLLEAGARRVIAVDVGHDQMDVAVANDPRVNRFDGVNARDLTADIVGTEPIGFIASDMSFISLKLALPKALELAARGALGIFLIKPQFEVGRGKLGKGGIVRDTALGAKVAREVAEWIGRQPGWRLTHFLPSPVEGADGNREYLAAGVKDV
ncbi:MAG: hemolysin [Alphaproteobacteria bacterium]|nr:MAG: hemolysin [Alphaproteobacteria bacterium]